MLQLALSPGCAFLCCFLRARLLTSLLRVLSRACVEQEVKAHRWFNDSDIKWDLLAKERAPAISKNPLWLKKTIVDAAENKDHMKQL